MNWSFRKKFSVKELYEELNAENEIIHLTYNDYLKSIELNNWYGNFMNYSDCTIINTMINLGINKIVSFDDGFKKIKGLNVLSNI